MKQMSPRTRAPARPIQSAHSVPGGSRSQATRARIIAANEDSWSTIVLSVSFSSRISPFAPTVIFWVRSPRATAWATCEMFRT